jgi:hypothetical protein
MKHLKQIDTDSLTLLIALVVSLAKLAIVIVVAAR